MDQWKLLMFFSTCALSLWGTDYTWTGISGDNWNTTTNWSPLGYPDAPADTATFPDVTNTVVDVNTNSYPVGQLSFTGTTDSYDIATTGGGTLSLGGGGYATTIVLGANTPSHTIGVPLVLGGNCVIQLGTGSGILNIAGGISEGYSVSLAGSGTVRLESTASTYTGSTTVGSGTVLETSAANLLASASEFTVNGTLNLLGNNNSITGLSGSGSVILGGGTLTILNGAMGDLLSGSITNGTSPSAVTLQNGYLNLSGANSYTGGTTITAGQLSLSGGGSLNNSAAVVVNGTFDISGLTGTSTTIGDLSGSNLGIINLGDKELIVGNGSSDTTTFNGVIQGTGGSLDYAGTGTLILGSPNTYTGSTAIMGGTLQASVAGAFAPASTYTLGSGATLALTMYPNTIASLFGSGAVSSTTSAGTLTITNGGSYSGAITGPGGLTLTGGTLTLSGASNTYSGATTVSNTAILQSGVANSFSSSSAVTLNGSAQLNLQTFSNTIPSLSSSSASAIANIGTGATLTLTNGGIFAGLIQGMGALDLTGGTLVLSNQNNSYTGGTTIATGADLQLNNPGALAPTGAVVVNGTFDISNADTSTTIGNLSGTNTGGSITLGVNQLVIDQTSPLTYAGNISGGLGSLKLEGSSILTLSGTSSYTGATEIVSSATLKAGSTTAFAPLSAFTVAGTLDLNNFSNTIDTLAGTGVVSTGVTPTTGGVLSISNGGNFSGQISGTGTSGGLVLSAGTLTLSGPNNFFGSATINNGATLIAGATNTLSINAAMEVNGTLNLANFPNAVASLFGAGTVLTGGALGILTVESGGVFSGGIQGLGGLTLNGGVLQMLNTLSSNTYSGPTTINNGGILQAGAVNTYSPNSAVTLTGTGELNLNGNNNAIFSLASGNPTPTTTNVSLGSGTLTISGSATTIYQGSITGSTGGLTINGGANLTLSGTTNAYSGPTSIETGTLQINANGALAPLTNVTVSPTGFFILESPETANSASSLTNNGSVTNNGVLTLATTYTQSPTATLTLNFGNTTPTNGSITAGGNISIAGTLNVIASTVPPPPPLAIYPLLTSTTAVTGTFSTFAPTGFGGTNPLLSYSSKQVSLYFSGVNAGWIYAATPTGNWGQGTNWSTGISPGENGNTNDVATFDAVMGMRQPTMLVILANAAGTAPQSVTLFEMNFNTAATSYTIQEFSSASTITFNANPTGTPLINVTAGSHFINAPIILAQSTELMLADGTMLTFLPLTTLQSLSTQTFTVVQTGGSTLDTGELVNNTTLTPFGFDVISASVLNNDSITPINSLNIVATAGQNATVTNTGPNAVMGPTASNGTFVIGGLGTTTVTNTGLGAVMGPSGKGGSLTVNSGTVTNSSGALFQAGSGGVLTITGGTIINDLTSTVGSSVQNINFTGGTLNTTGNVFAFDYAQSGTAILQINLTSIPTIVGTVTASGTATVGSSLIVDDLSGNAIANQSTTLVYAQRGVSGTYPNVTFLNFPAGVIPMIAYTPNAVVLEISSTVTPSSTGSLSQIPFISVTEGNIMLQREQHQLFETLRKKRKHKKAGKKKVANVSSESTLIAAIETQQPNDLAVRQFGDVQRQWHYLAERVIEEEVNSNRFYFGPIASTGQFKTLSTAQVGFNYGSEGVFTGYDYAFENWGLGAAATYSSLGATLFHHDGRLKVHQAHGSVYALWAPPSLNALAVSGIVGYGYDWFDPQRNAGHTLTKAKAKGSTHGSGMDALLGAEYIFASDQFSAMPTHLNITPLLNLQYIEILIDRYREHGAGVFDLQIKSLQAFSLKSCLGMRFEYFVEGKNVTFRPEIDIGWQLEYFNHPQHVHFSTVNLPETKHVSKQIYGAGRNTLWVGVDFLITAYKFFEIEMSYDFLWNSLLYRNHAFYLGVGGNF